MGKAKTSRKGKKEWRRNIDTSEVEAAVAKRSTEERQGLELSGKKNEDLFFVDKAASDPATSGGVVKKGKKREKKLLKCQAILQGAHSARPVEGVNKRKQKGGPGLKGHQLAKNGDAEAPAAPKEAVKEAAEGANVGDLWEEAGPAGDVWGMPEVKGKRQPTLRGRHSKTSREKPLPSVAAVEIDAPGCSYNPEFEQHQDAIAEAVATEVYKEIRKDLLPKAPPKTVDPKDVSELSELEQLLMPNGVEPEEEEEEEDEEEGEDEDEDGDGSGAATGRAAQRKTKAKRNREKSAREAARELEQRRALKKQRRELSNLRQLKAEINEEEEARDLMQQRRAVQDAEKAISKTPRLGKTAFKDAPIQVLTTDEVEGSLRRLKSHPMLVRDRFAALQKRGAVEPTRRVAKRTGRRVEIQSGNRTDRAAEAQAEIAEMTHKRKKLAKKLKKRGTL